MANKITKQDIDLLKFIAAFKILTVKQLVLISHRSEQVIRRRLRILSQEGLVKKRIRSFDRSKGRPEEITFLTEHGAKLLRDQGVVSTHLKALSENAQVYRARYNRGELIISCNTLFFILIVYMFN